MAYKRLDLAALLELDGGRIDEAFRQALRRCEVDMQDRPAVRTARTVTLTVTLEPIAGEAGQLETVDASFTVVDKQPRRKSRPYSLRADRDGALFGSVYAPEHAGQRTIDDVIGATGTDGKGVADAR